MPFSAENDVPETSSARRRALSGTGPPIFRTVLLLSVRRRVIRCEQPHFKNGIFHNNETVFEEMVIFYTNKFIFGIRIVFRKIIIFR